MVPCVNACTPSAQHIRMINPVFTCFERKLEKKLINKSISLSLKKPILEPSPIGTTPEKDINGLERRKIKRKRFGKHLERWCFAPYNCKFVCCFTHHHVCSCFCLIHQSNVILIVWEKVFLARKISKDKHNCIITRLIGSSKCWCLGIKKTIFDTIFGLKCCTCAFVLSCY